MKMIRIFGLLVLLFTFVGCKDDPVTPSCSNYTVNQGPFYMWESTVNSFPYPKSITKLVFKNEANEELVYTRSFSYRDTSLYSFWNTCPFDSTIHVPYVQTYEQIRASYTNDSLDMTLQLTFKADCDYEDAEVTGESDVANAFVSIFSKNIFASSRSTIALKSGNPPYAPYKYYTSITLGQRSFDNVYSNESLHNLPVNFIFYMNHDLGIVGFEEKASGQLWVFDRTE